MPDQYITMLTILSSGFLGSSAALLGVYLTNRSNAARLNAQLEHEERRRKLDLLRDRGEELYVLSDKWLNGIAGYYLNISAVMQGKLTYNQCLDLQIKAGKEQSYNFGRIVMLIDVYFPSTRDIYDEVIVKRTELNKVAAAHHKAYEQGDVDGTRFLNPFVKCQHGIEEAGERLEKKILESIRAV